ncbi:putative metal-binding motif-containing protein [Candidatus Nomurabacteria bacterium]|nr:putative metal-binding motif-containing protein [Candidatus Nomurabacteria bacterium]
MKKTLFSAIVGLITLFAMVLASPQESHAANCTMYAGELLSPYGHTAVYVLGLDDKLYFFPTQDVYRSWYGDDFSAVREIDPSCLVYKSLGGPMYYRPGTRLVKRVVSNDVYAVLEGGELRKIEDEASAKKFYGDNWGSKVRDVNDTFFGGYTPSNVKLNALHNGQFIKRGSQIFKIRNGKLYAYQSELPSYIRDAAILEDSSLTIGYGVAPGTIDLSGPFELSLPEANKTIATPVPPSRGNLVCTDTDGDGYNVEGGQCGPRDCDDSYKMSFPGANEICADGADNNCDGQIDENECKTRKICLGEGCPSTIIYEN